MQDRAHNELDLLAREVLGAHWGIREPPVRVEIGVNRQIWRVGQRWLSCTIEQRAAQVRRELRLSLRLGKRARLPAGVAVPAPLSGREGPLVSACGRVWWLTGHVAGRRPEPAARVDTIAVVRGLAGLHRWLKPLSPDLAVASEDSLTLFAHAQELLADTRLLGFSLTDQATLQQACELIEAYLSIRLPSPRQLIHGDPSYPNLRLSHGPLPRLIGALDWEECRLDFPLSDLSTVGQTVVFRAGLSDPLAGLAGIHAIYCQHTSSRFELRDLLMFMLLGKFESIAHHGTRFVGGEAPQELVLSQAAKMRTLLDLLRQVSGQGR
ncbi:MAG TPA: phosphotransferase [Ktedonobacteraceae bacterium]|jgi:macrolide phosphotransferase